MATTPSSFESERPPPSLSGLLGWEQQFVEATDGTRLYVRKRRGTGPLTSLLCDGIACDGFIWRYLADDLLAHSHVTHWNYRGHGRSSAPADPDHIHMAALSADLDTVRSQCVEGPTLLLGHSMGCQLVLEGFRSNPRGLAGLVLICGTSGRLTHTFKGSDALAQALPGIIERVQKHPHIARALWSNVPPEIATRVALATGEVDAAAIQPADLLAYSEHAVNLDLLMFLRMLKSVGDASAEDVLPQIDIPTLVIAGELDTFTPPHLAEQIAASIPDAELMMVPGATHVVPVERRDEVRERLARFINDRVRPRLDG